MEPLECHVLILAEEMHLVGLATRALASPDEEMEGCHEQSTLHLAPELHWPFLHLL